MYLNTVPFGGESIVGIKSASRTFFNTTPDSLTIDQAAVLGGHAQGTNSLQSQDQSGTLHGQEEYGDQSDGEVWIPG